MAVNFTRSLSFFVAFLLVTVLVVMSVLSFGYLWLGSHGRLYLHGESLALLGAIITYMTAACGTSYRVIAWRMGRTSAKLLFMQIAILVLLLLLLLRQALLSNDPAFVSFVASWPRIAVIGLVLIEMAATLVLIYRKKP